jgi:hypothetical protein
MKRGKITYYLCIIMLVFSLSLNAQGNSDGKRRNPPNPHKPPPPHPELPIDGGLSYLLLAGIGLGIYKLRRKK